MNPAALAAVARRLRPGRGARPWVEIDRPGGVT